MTIFGILNLFVNQLAQRVRLYILVSSISKVANLILKRAIKFSIYHIDKDEFFGRGSKIIVILLNFGGMLVAKMLFFTRLATFVRFLTYLILLFSTDLSVLWLLLLRLQNFRQPKSTCKRKVNELYRILTQLVILKSLLFVATVLSNVKLGVDWLNWISKIGRASWREMG